MSDTSFLPYGKQSIHQDDVRAVTKALKKGIITRGDTVEAFEQAIATYCGAAFAVAFSSGSTALAAAFFALDVGVHDEVMTTPNTFVSTLGTAIQRGARPVFVDIDGATGNMDLTQVKSAINNPMSRGKRVVVPVHFAGNVVDVQAISKAIYLPNVAIIEDAAHAIGSSYPTGEKVGSCPWSQCTIFSFHPVKTITTGEGGMVTTNDPDIADRLRLFRNNGITNNPVQLQQNPYPGYYEVLSYTNNFHLTDFQAALGLSQLKRIDSFIKKRRELVALYEDRLKNISSIRLFSSTERERTAYHLFVAQIDFSIFGIERNTVMQRLHERGIGTQVHYIPLYHHPVFLRDNSNLAPYFPEMERYYSEALSLPLFYDMRPEDVDRVVDACKHVLHID